MTTTLKWTRVRPGCYVAGQWRVQKSGDGIQGHYGVWQLLRLTSEGYELECHFDSARRAKAHVTREALRTTTGPPSDRKGGV